MKREDLAEFGRVAKALIEIRRRGLYREDAPTFRAYCKQEWGLSDDLIDLIERMDSETK